MQSIDLVALQERRCQTFKEQDTLEPSEVRNEKEREKEPDGRRKLIS